MAMAPQSLIPDPRCPKCAGRIDTKPFSLAALFGTVIVGDFATLALAGVFTVLGLMWEPAWAIALIIVVYAVARRSAAQAHYVCMQCHSEFTHKELYAVKRELPSNNTVETDARKGSARGSP